MSDNNPVAQNKPLKTAMAQKASENPNENYRIAVRDFLDYCGSDEISLDKITGFKTECEKKHKSSTVALKVKAVKSVIRKTMLQDPGINQGQRFQLEEALKDIKTVSQNARARKWNGRVR